jgi:thiamine biosynthesis lipoprotein
MKDARLIMGMPVVVDVADDAATSGTLEQVFSYLTYVDETFSTHKTTSEINRINRGEIAEADYSRDMREIFALAEKTKHETSGFFDIRTPEGTLDPSGVVKGWAILNAARILKGHPFENFYIDVGGDVQAEGKSESGGPWKIGIRDPFGGRDTIVKVVYVSGKGIATSGTYIRGQHIYDPRTGSAPANDIVSLTVVGPDVCEADRFATAAFVMGAQGIHFIEQLPGFEGYAIDQNGIATMTSGFEEYVL